MAKKLWAIVFAVNIVAISFAGMGWALEVAKFVDERRLVSAAVSWSENQAKLRLPMTIKRDRQKLIKQFQHNGATMDAMVKKLRPDMAASPDVQGVNVFRYTLEMVRKHKPEKAALVKKEFDIFLANQTIILLKTVAQALELYYMDTARRLDKSSEELYEFLAGDNPQPYLKFPAERVDSAGNIKDYWGNPIRYNLDNPFEYELYSPGPNGHDDGGKGDDIHHSAN